jgi:hypothetical protein
MRFTFLASCLFLAASACTVTTGPESTDRYATRDLSPSFVATSDGSKVTVVAQLLAHGAGTRGLELGDGDLLQVTLDGAAVPLAKDGDAYEGRVAQPAAASLGLVQVLFLRTKTRAESTASTVFVPKPFTIDASPDTWDTTGGELAVRTHDIAATDIDVVLEGSCLRDGRQALNVIVGGNGDVVVDAARVQFDDAPDCDVDVALQLTKVGAVDPTLGADGGGIRAVQERRFTVHVTS